MSTQTVETPKSRDVLRARGYETRANAYPGRCEECGCGWAADAARIARRAGSAWHLICKTRKCTSAFLGRQAVGTGDGGGNPIDNAG